MNVTKYLDSSSPNICKALWSAKVLDSVVLTCCRMDNDAAIKFLEITMENVVVASYNLRGGGDLPYEEIAAELRDHQVHLYPPEGRGRIRRQHCRQPRSQDE